MEHRNTHHEGIRKTFSLIDHIRHDVYLWLPGFTGKYASERENLRKEREDLKNELRRYISKLDMKDRLKQEIKMKKYQIDFLRKAQQEMQENRHEQ